jgi:hypothetical protein
MEKHIREIDMSTSFCEKCDYATSCRKLEPCKEFALAVGSNFSAELVSTVRGVDHLVLINAVIGVDPLALIDAVT